MKGIITGSFGQVKGEKSSAHTYILTRYRVQSILFSSRILYHTTPMANHLSIFDD